MLISLIDQGEDEFADSPQALGWATIEGSQTPDGRVLEDNGVVPDIAVALDREQLLQGMDAQLEGAIKHIEEQGAK